MDKKQILRAGNFIKNNGVVLRTINILRYKYNKLTGIESVVKSEGINSDEFLDSINFLTEENYISLRDITTKEVASLSDYDYIGLEAKVTGKGIRLLAGGINDTLVEV